MPYKLLHADTHTATLVFVSVAALHFYTKTLSVACAGEQGVETIEKLILHFIGPIFRF